MSPPLHRSPWQQLYERALMFLTALGGIAVGLGVLALSPPGLGGTHIVSWLALAIGVGAAAALLLGHHHPVLFLVAAAVLMGAVAPFVDLALAMALSTILVAVLTTGALLIERPAGYAAFVAVALVALAVRPALDLLGARPVAAASMPTGVPWIIGAATLILTAVGFRVLRHQLVRKEAHQQKMNDLIANVAHNLRTPLTAVIGFGYLLEAEVTGEPAREYAHRIVGRGWEISRSLDDLIITTRSDTESIEILRRPVDLRLAVNTCLTDVLGATVRLRYLSVDGMAVGDPERVRHIIRHLISNAVVHGGPVITIHSRLVGLKVELRVSDNGAALTEAEREQAFEPFQRLATTDRLLGKGVGLTVSRILAQAMGGDVRLESDHTGNTAILTLRADPTRAAPVAPQLLRPTPARS